MSVINTNIASLKAQQDQRHSGTALATSLERLASGLRVNSAKDDAAGQAIGNRMTSEIQGHYQARRNANDGISMAQTAEGALDEINERLQRVRELTVQGLNGTLNLDDADAIQAEINLNLKEIDRLAETSEFNGIPVLNGQAGVVKLQVGTHDDQELGIDLTPPGFDSESLGLKDFTIVGINGDVTPRDTVLGRARDIELNDGSTNVTYTNTTAIDPELRYSPSNGFGYYTQATDTEGNAAFYNAGIQAYHTTATDSSEVTVTQTVQPIYAPSTTIEAENFSQFEYRDENDVVLSDDNERALVLGDDDHYYLQTTDNTTGELRYQAAELNYQADTTRAVVSASTGDVLTASSFSPVGNVDGYDLSDAAVSVEYIAADQTAWTSGTESIVQDDSGNYYIQSEDAGEPVYYRATNPTAVTDEDGNTTLTFSAQDDTARQAAPFSTVTAVEASPTVPVDNTVEIRRADGTIMDSATTRLMQSTTGDYYIEEKVSNSEYRFHHATVGVTSDGETSTIIASIQSDSTPVVFNADMDQVETVSGYSTVTLDPRNVTVNYTDGDGQTFSDVLRTDGDGNYYFSINNDGSSEGGYKTATLVDDEGGDILIKTVNGNGDVIIYHPSQTVSSGVYNISVQTDANGVDDDGIAHTTINLTEVDQDIRLRQPENPLAALDRAIATVDAKRSHLGAMHNRLDSVISQQATETVNLSAARSRIMDADYATEISQMTKAQILQQAGTSVLAQANQVPQGVLSLLQ
ncbi:flagellin [Salinicola halophyticus]|uniref:flagellin N-terminal helical domain-containing protein n=1 Tax=Salinicola halophyticus TaxID=1808881 RepID=UPI000DA25287|nr:flagellin [Salinicola halophyticus]